MRWILFAALAAPLPAVEVIPFKAPGTPPAAVADKPAPLRPLAPLEERRRADEGGILERLKKGLEAQLGR